MDDSILEKIYRTTLKFLGPSSLEETYANIVQGAIDLVEGDEGRMLLQEGDDFNIVYISSPGASYPQEVRKKGYVYTAFTKRQSFCIKENQIRLIYPEIADRGIKSAVFIPLSYKSKSIGVLVIQSYKTEHFSSQELGILKLFGSMASLAVRKTQLHEETEKALHARDLFFSMAAHELRTPITTIYGYSQLLNNKTQGKDTVESRWIQSLHAESYRLTLLVQDLLEINRIRTNCSQFFLKECSLREMVCRATDNFKFNHPNRQIIVKDLLNNKSDIVIGDFDKLLQVVNNFLDNAAKFSPPESDIVLSLTSHLNDLTISIKDNGTGISKMERMKIFEEYYRGKDTNVEGMGLGLYLAKNIIKYHHGIIKLHSKINQGTTIEVSLPKPGVYHK